MRYAGDQPALDCHLMIDDPDRWAPPYAERGAYNVTFHVEAAADRCRPPARSGPPERWRPRIKPNTSLDPYVDVLVEFDTLL